MMNKKRTKLQHGPFCFESIYYLSINNLYHFKGNTNN